MSGDKDDLSQFVAQSFRRRARKSTGAEAGMPKDNLPRERIYCQGCHKFIRFKNVYSKFEFKSGVAWRMRFCLFCDTMVQEVRYDLTKGEKCSANDAIKKLRQN